jgi:hypothetical protein
MPPVSVGGLVKTCWNGVSQGLKLAFGEMDHATRHPCPSLLQKLLFVVGWICLGLSFTFD